MSFLKKNKFFLMSSVLFVLLSFFSFEAFAQAGAKGNGGWNTAANNIGAFGRSAIIAITILCAAAGVGAIGFAGKLLMKKSGERGDDVEWSKVGYATLAGAFLLSVAFIATTTVETLGGDTNEIGKALTIK